MSLTRIGFDVSTSLGLISAATDDNQVLIFDLWTGKEIRSDPDLLERRYDRVKCLSFVDDHVPCGRVDESSRDGLLVGSGGIVEKWHW